MTYATRSHMIAAFGEDELIELTDRAETGAVVDAVLAAALAAADAEIDGYVGRVAVLPLTVVPDSLRQIAMVIARYRLSTDQVDGRVRLDYEDAVHTLESIAKGLFILDLPVAASETAASKSHRVQGVASPRVFVPGQGSAWP